MRIVLDTNVLIRANPKAAGPARDLLLAITSSDKHTLVVSQPLLQELERVLHYSRVQNLWSLTRSDIEEYIDLVAHVAEVTPSVSGDRVVPNDPQDDFVVFAALIGRADVLCTLDTHFFETGVLTLCARYGIRVLGDVDLLHLIRDPEDLGRDL